MLLPLQVLAEWIALHITGMGPLDPWMLKMTSVGHSTYGGIQMLLFQN